MVRLSRKCAVPAGLLLGFLACFAPPPASAGAPSGAPSGARARTEPVPGQIVIELAPASVPATAFRFGPGRPVRTGLDDLDARLQSVDAAGLEPVFDLDVDGAAKRAAGLDRFYRVRFHERLDPAEAVRRFDNSPHVLSAEPSRRYSILLTPNDPTYPSQWAHNNTGQAISHGGGLVGTPDADTDTPEAWDLGTGSPNLILAILDTGVDLGHPEFAGRVVPGWDFVNGDADASDDHGHGTACAGIALAAGNNGQGIAGVAWGVKLMPVKVMAFDGFGSDTDVANGITFAADNGARILSMSIGGFQSSVINVALNYAVNTKGCAAFAAAGNGDAPFLDYPAAYSTCISVGALSPCNERKKPTSCDGEAWWGSNYGTGLQFMAPGVRIHTTDIRGAAGLGSDDYVTNFNGTSSATPHAAGIGALVWSKNPSLTSGQMWQKLILSADNLGPAGWDAETGYGRLNAYGAVQLAGGVTTTLFSETFESGTVPGSVWSAGDANSSSGLDYWGAQTVASGARVHGGSASAYCAHNASPAGQAYDNNMNSDMTLINAINVAGYTDVKITFWKWFKTAHSSDYLSFQYWNGSSWAEHQRWTASDATWRSHTYTLTGFSTYRFRFVFVSNNSKTDEGAYIDDITVTGVGGASAAESFATLERTPELEAAAVPAPGRLLRAGVNPFLRGTALHFDLPRNGEARLSIYTVAGRRVAVLVDAVLAAGPHSVAWAGTDINGSPAAPGVYFARLELDGVPLATERLVRIR